MSSDSEMVSKVTGCIALLVAIALFIYVAKRLYRILTSVTKAQNQRSDGYHLVSPDDPRIVSPHEIQLVEKKLMNFDDIPFENTLNFLLNGTTIQLVNPEPTESLVSFIRDKAGLKGTKLGCQEVIVRTFFESFVSSSCPHTSRVVAEHARSYSRLTKVGSCQ